MPFIKEEIEILAIKVAEYKLISDLATDPVKRQQYLLLAQELRELVKKITASHAPTQPLGATNTDPHADS